MSETKSLGIYGLFNDFRAGARGIGKMANSTRNGSLTEYLKSTAVEPVTIVESRLTHSEVIEPLLHNLLDIYAGMYLQVASRTMAVDIDNVKVTRMLEKLATNRDVLGSIAATESANKDFLSVALEADRKERVSSRMEIDGKSFAPIHDNSQLSVGKLIKLSISNGNESLDIPVSIRLAVKNASAELITDMFEANHQDLNMFSRLKLVQLQELTMMEALTGSDLIKKQERVRMADKDGILTSHFTNAMKEVGYSALTGEVAINRASGMSVISSQTAKMIEAQTRGPLDKFKHREKYFAGTAATIIAIVDEQDECVDIYYRGFKDGSTYTFRQLARKDKGSNDLTPVVKDMLQGQVPSF